MNNDESCDLILVKKKIFFKFNMNSFDYKGIIAMVTLKFSRYFGVTDAMVTGDAKKSLTIKCSYTICRLVF